MNPDRLVRVVVLALAVAGFAPIARGSRAAGAALARDVSARGALAHAVPAGAALERPALPSPFMGELAGHWQGQWTRDGSVLEVGMDFAKSDSGYTGSFGSDALRALDNPFRLVWSDVTHVRWLLIGDGTTTKFDGRIVGDEMSGSFDDGTGKGTFRAKRSAEVSAPPYSAQEVRFTNGDVTLAGTLIVPHGAGPHPAIVFVHGSGGEGRFASRYLAERFARAGFAALIYDKRGVGGSGGDWKHATFDDLAGDALAAIRMLAADPRVRADAIGLHGHSQGGTIAPLIASQAPRLAFVIASAAGGVRLPDAERYSYRNFLGISRLHGADSLRAMAYIDLVVEVGYGGQSWDRADSAAKSNANEKWFSSIPGREDSFWWLAPRTASYDPAHYWRLVKTPVLLVYGEKDERVPVEASRSNIEAALRAAGNTDVTSKVFPASDHTFRINESADGRFHWPRTPDGYLETLIGWAKSKTQTR